MAKSKLNSIRLNQIIDSNKIDTETFVVVYLQSKIEKAKLIRKYFGGYKQLNVEANAIINSGCTLRSLHGLLEDVENSIKSGEFEGIRMWGNRLCIAKEK